MSMSEYTPEVALGMAQRLKYRYIAVLCGVILLNFLLLRFVLPPQYDWLKYISVLALIFYVILLTMYKFNAKFPPPEYSSVTSPIHGKVVMIKAEPNGHLITIKKTILKACEIVSTTISDLPNTIDMDSEQVSWQILGLETDSFLKNFAKVFIDETIPYQGILVGLVPGNATCEVFLPKKYVINIRMGDDVEAGYSILGYVSEEDLTMN